MRKVESQVEGKDEPLLITWSQRDLNMREPHMPALAKVGWHAALFVPTLEGVNFRFYASYLPFGHARPFHIAENIEIVIFVLEGQVEVGVGPNPDDLRYFQLGKYDTLFVPNGMGVDFRNIGEGDTRSLITASRIGGEWPKEVIYYLPGEDTPFARKLRF